MFLKGKHKKGTEFFCVVETGVDVSIEQDDGGSDRNDFLSFALGEGSILKCMGDDGDQPKAVIYMVNHHPDPAARNVKIRMFRQEYTNERDNLVYVFGVKLLVDIDQRDGELTELYYRYQEQRKNYKRKSRGSGSRWIAALNVDEVVLNRYMEENRQKMGNGLILGTVLEDTGYEPRNAPIALRNKVLGTLFPNLFSLKSVNGGFSARHINAGVGRRSVGDTTQKLGGLKLDYIMLEYTSVTKTYFCDKLLVGSPQVKTTEANAGGRLLTYIDGLRRGGHLNPGCRMILANVRNEGTGTDLPQAAINKLESKFGSARHVQVGVVGRRR